MAMNEKTAWTQMCTALCTEKPKRTKRAQKPWRGGLADVAAYGKRGLQKIQEREHG